MKKNILYITLVSLALILTGVGSFLLGSQNKNKTVLPKTATENTTVPTSTANLEEGLEIRKIAVVNLDEGIYKNGRVVNYASEISRYPSDDFYSTGLEDAKRGILTGDYGAYVVIPATFSESVESLNVKIQKAQITYSVNNQLKDRTKLDVKDEINEYTKQLNQSVSYLYVDSILNEFQGTQATISTVLLNNNQGNEALATVAPADLINFIKIPELKKPDSFVEAIDIDAEIAKNSELLAGIIEDYQSGIETGQEGAEQVVAKGNTLTENMITSFDEIGSKTIGRDSEGNFKYKDEMAATTGGLSTYLTDAADWVSGTTNTVVEQVPTIQEALESAQHFYNNSEGGPTPYDNQVATLADYYRRVNVELDMAPMGVEISLPTATIESYLSGDTLVLRDKDGTIVDSHLLETRTVTPAPDPTIPPDPNAIPAPDIVDYVLTGEEMVDIINSLSGMTTSSITGEPVAKVVNEGGEDITEAGFNEAVISTHIPRYGAFNFFKDETTNEMNEGTEPDEGLNRLTKSLTTIQTLTQTLDKLSLTNKDNLLNEDTRKKETSKIQSDLKTNVVDKLEIEANSLNGELKDKSTNLSGETRDYSQIVTNYDPFSYLNQTALKGNFNFMQENNTSIQTKAVDHIGKMSENVLDTYTLYNENQLSLLDETQIATDKGTEKVTESLSTAKETLSDLMDDNYALLQPITTKLAYTKTGDVADQSVYQYIVSPLTVSNQSEEHKVATSESKTEEPEHKVATQAAPEQKTSRNKLMVPLIGGLLLFVLVCIGIIAIVSRNKKNTQKW